VDARNPNHQLIGGKHPIICGVSNILSVVQDIFHPPDHSKRGEEWLIMVV
jgi:hypothetical protein